MIESRSLRLRRLFAALRSPILPQQARSTCFTIGGGDSLAESKVVGWCPWLASQETMPVIVAINVSLFSNLKTLPWLSVSRHHACPPAASGSALFEGVYL